MKQHPFQNPDDRYRGLDLWMINDQLEDEEIEKQIYRPRSVHAFTGQGRHESRV